MWLIQIKKNSYSDLIKSQQKKTLPYFVSFHAFNGFPVIQIWKKKLLPNKSEKSSAKSLKICCQQLGTVFFLYELIFYLSYYSVFKQQQQQQEKTRTIRLMHANAKKHRIFFLMANIKIISIERRNTSKRRNVFF